MKYILLKHLALKNEGVSMKCLIRGCHNDGVCSKANLDGLTKYKMNPYNITNHGIWQCASVEGHCPPICCLFRME